MKLILWINLNRKLNVVRICTNQVKEMGYSWFIFQTQTKITLSCNGFCLRTGTFIMKKSKKGKVLGVLFSIKGHFGVSVRPRDPRFLQERAMWLMFHIVSQGPTTGHVPQPAPWTAWSLDEFPFPSPIYLYWALNICQKHWTLFNAVVTKRLFLSASDKFYNKFSHVMIFSRSLLKWNQQH